MKNQLILMLVAAITLFSCGEDRPLNTAIGKAGQVLVVSENDIWESLPGEAFREYMSEEFKVLPQPEPIFDVKYVKGIDMTRLQKEWRVIVFIGDLSKNTKTTKEITRIIGKEGVERAKIDFDYNTAVLEDLWAEGQLVIYIFAPNKAQLLENIKKKQQSIIQKIEEADKRKISANTYQSGLNRKLGEKIQSKLGVKMSIPGTYKAAVLDSVNREMWIRRETGEISSNILLRVSSYSEDTQLNEESILALRDSIGRRLVTSRVKGSYMISDKVNMMPVFSKTDINGYYALEVKGLWNMKNDFMGGPFASYMVYNPKSQKVVFVDGFIYAPGEDKRSLMQQLELIIRSLKF